MPHLAAHAFTRQKLSIDFVTLRHACPKGVYVAPVPDEDLLWSGIIFVRKGPYANAVLRFQIAFTDDYPARPPVVTFQTDVFHPLIAPLTTYTSTTRDRGGEISAADHEKLARGGLTLRHGFPEWYSTSDGNAPTQSLDSELSSNTASADEGSPAAQTQCKPHIIEVLQYMRVILDTEAVIDSVPLEIAANPGAWHAWRSHRVRLLEPARQPVSSVVDGGISRDRSMSPSKQQPGGARRPGEWNWTGVWEDRVKKAVQASISDATLFGGDGSDEIEFVKMDDNAISKLAPVLAARTG